MANDEAQTEYDGQKREKIEYFLRPICSVLIFKRSLRDPKEMPLNLHLIIYLTNAEQHQYE
jgi:hypothetical protein